ncbi:hypothetical protein PG991_008872 [Apiospora marii]|uniref:Uncharacterized protein n=1 Tax=Apiospora marii TaxID=335849 RepID=A0ABR1RLX8_9PEZI
MVPGVDPAGEMLEAGRGDDEQTYRAADRVIMHAQYLDNTKPDQSGSQGVVTPAGSRVDKLSDDDTLFDECMGSRLMAVQLAMGWTNRKCLIPRQSWQMGETLMIRVFMRGSQ